MPDETEDKDKKPKPKKWINNFGGKLVYDRNGIKVLEPVDSSVPFSVVVVGKNKKIIPKGTDITKIDLSKQPDLNGDEYDKNIEALGLDKREAPKVTSLQMRDWNRYTDFLKKKELSGNIIMQHDETSRKSMDDFLKENPDAKINYDNVKDIQKVMHDYRDYAINEFKQGKTQPPEGAGENYEKFMQPLTGTPDDGKVGIYTSQFVFPESYLKIYDEQNNKTTTQDLGFAIKE